MSRAAPVIALVLSVTACDPSGPADLGAAVPFEQGAAGGKVALPPPGAEPPPAPEDGVCGGVLKMTARILERMRAERPPEAVFDALDRCFERSGRVSELIAFYREALKVDATGADPDIRARLAGAFLLLGDSSEALREVERILAASADHPEALFLKGLVHASGSSNDPRAKRIALRSWRRLLEVAPEHQGMGGMTPAQIRARTERWARDLGEAPPVQAPIPAPTSAPTSLPATPRAASPGNAPGNAPAPEPAHNYARSMFEAVQALQAGDGAAARRGFEAALRARPDSADAREGLEAARALKP